MYLVSRTKTFAKLFFIVSFTGLFMYAALAFYSYYTGYGTVFQIPVYRFGRLRDTFVDPSEMFMKFILMWTINDTDTIQEGRGLFLDYGCPDVNCYITSNKSILDGDYRNFDAIVFTFSFYLWQTPLLPKYRSPRQKYVFYSKLPSNDYPICNVIVNNYLNWTWTYKFKSDIFEPFIEVKDLDGNVVAPKDNVVWKKSSLFLTNFMNEIGEVNTKTKAIAWIMNDCSLKVKSVVSTRKLQRALNDHSLQLDIFGCGHQVCPKGGCLAAIERDYYFYLAHENGILEDYVTDEVLMAYDHDAVPIVVGGANYSKFLPDDSYINFNHLNEEKLAALVAYIIRNPSRYREYFNWKKQYTIRKVKDYKGFCQLCSLLNNNKEVFKRSSYEDFRKWWYDGPLRGKCLPKGAETYNEVLSYANVTKKYYTVY